MPRKLVWASDARRDLAEILTFIRARSPSAAQRLNQVVREGAERILTLPLGFRPGRVPDTRECIVHPNYLLVYRVYDDRVRILRVMHSRRNYP